MRKRIAAPTVLTLLLSTQAFAQPGTDKFDRNPFEPAQCQIPQDVIANVQSKLATVVAMPDHNGGLFSPNRMWSAIVDRKGTLCSIIVTGDAWPGAAA